MRNLSIVLALLALVGCASTPKVKQPDQSGAPLAVLGIAECGKLQGIVVVTKAGEIVPVQDTDEADLKALGQSLPDDSAGEIDLTDNCPPTQSTLFR